MILCRISCLPSSHVRLLSPASLPLTLKGANLGSKPRLGRENVELIYILSILPSTIKPCLTVGATHLGKTFVGRSPDTIPVDMYSFSDTRLNGTTAYVTVGPDCTPIEAHFAGTYPNGRCSGVKPQ